MTPVQETWIPVRIQAYCMNRLAWEDPEDRPVESSVRVDALVQP